MTSGGSPLCGETYFRFGPTGCSRGPAVGAWWPVLEFRKIQTVLRLRSVFKVTWLICSKPLMRTASGLRPRRGPTLALG